MFVFLISVPVGVFACLAFGLSDCVGWGWSVFFGVLAFAFAQAVLGLRFRKKVKAEMDAVQAIIAAGQKRLEAKTHRWQMHPPGSVKEARNEMLRDQRAFLSEALAVTEGLHRFDRWVPLMARQIATAQFQLHWMMRDFKRVDELMPRVLLVDPAMSAMKMARMHVTGAPTAAIGEVYAKAVRRARYNGNVLAAATWSWILVKRGETDAAFRALNDALRNSDDATLKANRDHLANNRVSHFSNSGIGDPWWSLFLEEPRIRQPRQRVQWR